MRAVAATKPDAVVAGLQVVWQPVVWLETLEIIGYECLARAKGRCDGASPVPELLKGNWAALDLALVQLALDTLSWLAPGKKLFVNVTVPTVIRLVTESQEVWRHPSVVWEITEHAAELDWPANVRATLASADNYAVDDLGAGNQDLLKLTRWRPPWIKLDRGLVAGISADRSRQKLVQGIIWAVGTWTVQVVAEGIESPDDLETVRRLGVRYGQGYLFGRPAVPEVYAAKAGG